MNTKEAINILEISLATQDGKKKEALIKAIYALKLNIPKKPYSTIEFEEGKQYLQPLCPNCEDYLTEVPPDGANVTYCENCGQAIDWWCWHFGE